MSNIVCKLGSFYSIRSASRFCGLSPGSLWQTLYNLDSKLWSYLKTNGVDSLESDKRISESCLLLILNYYAFGVGGVTKEKAYESLCIMKPGHYEERKKVKRTNKKEERLYKLALAKKLKAHTEVNTVAGKIDVLTSTQIIEIKEVKGWKSALGQILVYGQFYPSHQKRIHLFGETQESYLEMIRKIVEKYDVIVTWER
jgi:hypothetical protein